MKKPLIILLMIILVLSGCNTQNNGISIGEGHNEAFRGTVKLYFADKYFTDLVVEEREIETTENIYKRIVEELIKGPSKTELNPVLKDDVELVDINIDGKILRLAFNEAFLRGGELAKMFAIQSLEQTFKEFSEIEEIKIYVNDEQIT